MQKASMNEKNKTNKEGLIVCQVNIPQMAVEKRPRSERRTPRAIGVPSSEHVVRFDQRNPEVYLERLVPAASSAPGWR